MRRSSKEGEYQVEEPARADVGGNYCMAVKPQCQRPPSGKGNYQGVQGMQTKWRTNERPRTDSTVTGLWA